MGKFGFWTEGDSSQNSYYNNNTKGLISFFCDDINGAKFQEHCLNISRDIAYSVFTTFQLQYYDIITDLTCIIEKPQYL